MEQFYPFIVFGAFTSFLLAFLYAILRWCLADARSRGRSGWPLAALMVAVPILAFAARRAFPAYVPSVVFAGVALGVPLIAWVAWLFIRPAVQEESADPILIGRDGAASRWILILSVAAAGYNVAMGLFGQIAYPLYLAVPPASFPAYFAQYNEAIVFPVIVALSLTWVLFVVLILFRPSVIPSWAAWSAAGLALLGFVASSAFEFPYNRELMEHGYNAQAIQAKISGNWYRLIPWTLQAGLLLWMANLALSAGAKAAPEDGSQ